MSSEEAYILYVDHQGHPSPLSQCYHATASRRLASAVNRFPPSTITEVDSAYCPQCLVSSDTGVGARLGFCNKATCQRCPLCQSVASITTNDNQCFYKCGLCDWNSLECNLGIGITTDEDGDVDRLELARAAEDLLGELNRRKSEQTSDLDKHFNALTSVWDRKRATEGHAPPRVNLTTDLLGGWSVEDLEKSMVAKAKMIDETAIEEANVAGIQIHRPSLDDELVDLDLDESILDVPRFSFRLQSLNSPVLPRTRQDLLPLPIPLRVRTSRRCRAELAEGRPGILLKPKLDPLEGDTSQRAGHGQWWKKDSSAVHIIPRVTVIENVKVVRNGNHVLLLKVTNPTLGSIRVRFASSSYRGEPDWDDAEAALNPMLSGLLLDTWTQDCVDAELIPDLLKDLNPTATVELLSAEDSIIELGGIKARQVPDNVANWEASSIASESESFLRLVAHSASTAWFEMVLVGIPTKETATAVPLSLQIEVGNGSWESSLIQTRPLENDEADRVTFDLVLIIGPN